MRVKIQVDTAALISVHLRADGSLVGDVEEPKKNKPVFVEVEPNEYVQISEDLEATHHGNEDK